MAYAPGTFGQKPRRNINTRIRKLRNLIIKNKISIDIAIDGGVSPNNINQYKKSGANCFIFGNSGLFVKDKGLREQINLIKKILNI